MKNLLRKLLNQLIPQNVNSTSNTTTNFAVLRTESIPVDYWIELTSMCPFDCVFCSRASLRGKGKHMDIALYRHLISQMKNPEIIRLNYSGESIHYPHLTEAITLAKSINARVELVSALSSAKPKMIKDLVSAGLDRLTVSIHALDETLYSEIYKHSSAAALHENLNLLASYKQQLGTDLPTIDFAFVAMKKNLGELENIVQLADKLNIKQVDIHPVIRRDEIPEQFNAELIAGKLSPSFSQQLSGSLEQLNQKFPNVRLNVSSTEFQAEHAITDTPAIYPPALPAGAKIHSCEQNPWRTLHVLANGDAVTCEVRDNIVMGNLHEVSLHDLWNSEEYFSFRRNYTDGRDKKCSQCIYKIAYLPLGDAEQSSSISGQLGSAQLIKGWHTAEKSIVWSSANHSIALLTQHKKNNFIYIHGILPQARNNTSNKLRITYQKKEITIINSNADSIDFSCEFSLDKTSNTVAIEFFIDELHTPNERGYSSDTRRLGFALKGITCV